MDFHNKSDCISHPNPHWTIWSASKSLSYRGSSSLLNTARSSQQNSYVDYSHLSHKVSQILYQLGHQYAGKHEYQSIFNKSSLLHEVEESIVAIHALLDWLFVYKRNVKDENKDENNFVITNHDDADGKEDNDFITVIDLCCGKGIFSMILSYLATETETTGDNSSNDVVPSKDNIMSSLCPETKIAVSKLDESLKILRQYVKQIIMIDKATSNEINWNHIHEVNSIISSSAKKSSSLNNKGPSQQQEQQSDSICIKPVIPITIWEGINILHNENTTKNGIKENNDDIMYSKLSSLQGQLCIIGIHLCKNLSPKCISLFNILGKSKAPFLCLAPCCLPPVVTRKLRKANRERKMKKKEQLCKTVFRPDIFPIINSSEKSINVMNENDNIVTNNHDETTKQQVTNIDQSSDKDLLCILIYETTKERSIRNYQQQLRNQANGKYERRKINFCYLCQQDGPFGRDCPTLIRDNQMVDLNAGIQHDLQQAKHKHHQEQQKRQQIECSSEKETILEMIGKTSACWKCGMFGHVKAKCPLLKSSKESMEPEPSSLLPNKDGTTTISSSGRKPTVSAPPFISVDVSSLFRNKTSHTKDGGGGDTIQRNDVFFQSYCKLLADSIQVNDSYDNSSGGGGGKVYVQSTPLVNQSNDNSESIMLVDDEDYCGYCENKVDNEKLQTKKRSQQHENNRVAGRKSVYIVANR